MSADTTENLASASRVKIKNQPGPSSRFKSHHNDKLNSSNSTGLSKKAMRRLRQKNKKHQQADNAKVEWDDLKKEVDMLKVMKRLNSDPNTIKAKEKIVSNGTVQNGKCKGILWDHVKKRLISYYFKTYPCLT